MASSRAFRRPYASDLKFPAKSRIFAILPTSRVSRSYCQCIKGGSNLPILLNCPQVYGPHHKPPAT